MVIFRLVKKDFFRERLERLCSYPIIYDRLMESLKNSPSNVKSVLDKILWASLYGSSLLEELTLSDWACLSSWMEKVQKPKGFPEIVENKIKRELNFGFCGRAS